LILNRLYEQVNAEMRTIYYDFGDRTTDVCNRIVDYDDKH